MTLVHGMLSPMARPAPAPAPVLSLDALARRAAGGDRPALEEALRQIAPDIAKLCHYVAGPNDGEDAAQQALEKLIHRIGRFDGARGSFRSWALTVARNTCRDRLRRRGTERRRRGGDESAVERAPTGVPSPERLVLARLDAGDLAAALETLPEGMRSAIVLFHVQGASYAEIADILAVPKGTVMTWLHRGRKRLREALEAR
ncbi:MAG: RNA polymerase sigma factor [Myxococcota bacterium]